MSTGSAGGQVRSGHAGARPLPDDFVELVADRFRALADPTRIKLLDRLREHEATVLELTALVGTTQQNVSKHLNLLQHWGIVARRKQGNFSYYRISDDTVHTLCQVVCGSLQHRFDTLRRISGAGAERSRQAASSRRKAGTARA
jgi:DNA-binding transcriptional ArsR family regulator